MSVQPSAYSSGPGTPARSSSLAASLPLKQGASAVASDTVCGVEQTRKEGTVGSVRRILRCPRIPTSPELPSGRGEGFLCPPTRSQARGDGRQVRRALRLTASSPDEAWESGTHQVTRPRASSAALQNPRGGQQLPVLYVCVQCPRSPQTPAQAATIRESASGGRPVAFTVAQASRALARSAL